jgi:hypothetical protein
MAERLIYEPRTGPEFAARVREIAGRLMADPNHLMAVMGFETAGTFRADIVNAAGSGATGLIQFMPTTARSLDTTTGQLAAMSPIDQLEYVERYLWPYRGRLRRLIDCYLAVLLPSAIGKPDHHVLWRSPSIAYRQNAGLDAERRGEIRVGDVARRIQRAYDRGREELAEAGAPPVPPKP